MNHPLEAANQISKYSKESLEQVAQMWRSMLKALYLVRWYLVSGYLHSSEDIFWNLKKIH